MSIGILMFLIFQMTMQVLNSQINVAFYDEFAFLDRFLEE